MPALGRGVREVPGAGSAARDAGMRKAGGGCCGGRWERVGPALMPALPPRAAGRVSKSPLREVVPAPSPRAAPARVTGVFCVSLAGHDSPAGKRAQRNEVGNGSSLEGVPGPPQCQDGPGHRNCCVQVRGITAGVSGILIALRMLLAREALPQLRNICMR